MPSFVMLTLLETNYAATLAFHNKKSVVQHKFVEMISEMTGDITKRLYGKKTQVQVSFETMLSMSQNEVAILWYTNCVELPCRIVEYLRDIDVKLTHKGSTESLPLKTLYGSRTLFSITQGAYTENAESPVSKGVKLLVSLSYKEPSIEEDFRKNLTEYCKNNKKPILHDRYGSHDSVFELPFCKEVINLYMERVDNQKNPFRSEFCRQIHTRILLPNNPRNLQIAEDFGSISIEIDPDMNCSFQTIKECNLNSHNNRTMKNCDRVETAFNKLTVKREDTKKKKAPKVGTDSKTDRDTFFDRNPFLQEALYNLKIDFYRCIHATTNPVWAKDLEEQFISVLNAVDLIIDKMPDYTPREKNQDDEYLIDRINTLIKTMQQVYGHVTQGSKLFYEAPGSSMPYSGAFRSIVWTYNGILKSILTMIYSTRRDTQQDKITPIIIFDMSPVIKVDHFDTHGDNKEDKEKLLIYHLPAAALYNVMPYIKMLLHESHHISTPSSRYIRNKVIGTNFVCSYFTSFLHWRIGKDDALSVNSKSRVSGELMYHRMSEEFWKSYNDLMLEILREYENVNLEGSSDYFQYILKESLRCISKSTIEPGKHLVKLLEKVRDDCSTPDITIAINSFLPGMKKDVCLYPKTYDESVAERIIESCEEDVEAIHEACCDLFMIQCSTMDATQYLDFLCDYLYTIMKPFNADLSSDIPRSYPVRIGMVINYYCDHIIQSEELHAKKESTMLAKKANEIIQSWQEYNKKLSENRKNENRSTHRTDFRKSMIDRAIKPILDRYYLLTMSRTQLHVLLDINNIDTIQKDMFTILPDESDSIKSALCDEEKRFQLHSQIIQKAFDEYNNIQGSNRQKSERERMIMRLIFKLTQYYSGETRSWSDIWKECNQTEFYKRNKLIYQHPAYESAPYLREYNVEYHVHIFDDFIPTLNSLADKLNKGKNRTEEETVGVIWYRGVERSGYDQTPSIYRKYGKSLPEPLNGRSSIYQRRLLDEFIARASNSGEIDLAQVNSTADWLSVMQHYSAKTHFLDWSEQLFGAMYFMLEPVMRQKYEKDNEEIKARVYMTKKEGASLYLLAPQKLNDAWLKAYKDMHGIDKCKCREDLLEKLEMYGGTIPNLSRSDAADIYSSHLLGCDFCIKCESAKKEGCDKDSCSRKECKLDECAINLPIAIQTNRSNKRIAAQAGTFVAFSPNANKCRNQYDLLEIQSKLLEKNSDMEPFVYKLVVHESAIDDLANWLETVGMRTFRFYPDLEYIGRDVSDSIS